MALEFDANRRLFRVTLEGNVDIAQCLEILAALLAHPNFEPGIPAIWNAMDADLSQLSFQDFQQMRAYQARHSRERGRARIALVAAGDLSFGMGRMVAQIADLPHLEINVFRDVAAAEKWALAPRTLPEFKK